MSALALARPQLPAASAYLPAQQKFNHLLTELRSAQTQRMTHSELENMIEVEGRELLRLLLQAHFDERAPGTTISPVVDARGRVRTHRRQLETIFGTVSVTRTGYGGYCQVNLMKKQKFIRSGKWHPPILTLMASHDFLQAASWTQLTSAQAANLNFITAR